MDIDRQKLIVLHEAIRKARNEVIRDNAQEYLKRFKKQPWYGAAVSGYVEITDQLGALLQEWQSGTLKIIDKENIFTGPADVVEKAGKYRTEEYLDNRYNKVVVDDIRDELVELQQLYRSKLEALFESIIAGKLATGITGALKTDHFPFNFNKYNTLVRDTLKDKKIHWAKQVADTTERRVKSALVDGYEKGLSNFDIASNIKARTTFSIFRAEKVARTETMASASLADYARFAANDDVIGYRWRSANNDRSRASHKAANNQFRAKGQPFMVGGYKMLHPGDNTYGAPAKEIVNCRCWLEPVFADEIDSLTPKERSSLKQTGKGLSAGGNASREKSIPKFVGKIDFNNQKLVQSKLKEFRKFAIDKTVEYALVILPNGKCYRFMGNENTVHPEVLGLALQGAVVSHNHTNDETEYSFSNEDFELFVEYGLTELYGFDKKYEYLLRNKGKTPEIQLKNIFDVSVEEYQHQRIYEKALEEGIYYERVERTIASGRK